MSIQPAGGSGSGNGGGVPGGTSGGGDFSGGGSDVVIYTLSNPDSDEKGVAGPVVESDGTQSAHKNAPARNGAHSFV